MTFEEFWRKHEKELAARAYGAEGWASPYEIARAVWELALNGVTR